MIFTHLLLQVAAASHVLLLPAVGGDGNSVVVVVIVVGALLHVGHARQRKRQQRATAQLSTRGNRYYRAPRLQ